MPQMGENGCPTVYLVHRASKRPTGPQLGIPRLLITNSTTIPAITERSIRTYKSHFIQKRIT